MAYPMPHICFELAQRIYFFEAFWMKGPELRITITRRMANILGRVQHMEGD